MKIKSVDKYLKAIGNKIDVTSKVAFITAFLGTFLCHLMFFVHSWANEDGLFGAVVESNMLGSGRFMPGNVLCEFVSPVVLLIIAATVLSVVAVLVVKLLKIENKLYAGSISLLLVTFPVLSMSFGYSFMIERYMLGLLFSVLSVWIVEKGKFGFVLGGILLAVSLGYYQAYVTVAISLSIILVFMKLLEHKSFKDTMSYILKYVLMGIIGVAIYLSIVKVLYGIFGVELLDYKGLNNVGSIPPFSDWSYLLQRTYGHVIYFLLGKRFYRPPLLGLVAQLASVGVTALMMFKVMRDNSKGMFNSIAIIVALLLLPFGMNILDFLLYETHISSLNVYQFVFIFVLPFVLLTRLKVSGKKENVFVSVLEMVCVVSTFVIIWSNFTLNNVYYTKMEKYNEATVLLTNRIFGRIESFDGVDKNTKVFLGNRTGVYGMDDSSIYDDRILVDQGLWGQFIGYSTSQADYSDYKFHSITKNLIGLQYEQISNEEREKIIQSEEYENMAVWPNSNSIKFVGDTLVVKLS